MFAFGRDVVDKAATGENVSSTGLEEKKLLFERVSSETNEHLYEKAGFGWLLWHLQSENQANCNAWVYISLLP